MMMVELRLKNLIRADQMPYKNPAGAIYDCGDFEKILRGAMQAADWKGFASRKAAAEKRGLLYGRGVGCYVEITGSARTSENVILAVQYQGMPAAEAKQRAQAALDEVGQTAKADTNWRKIAGE